MKMNIAGVAGNAQDARNRTLAIHEQSIAIISVLGGSRSTITEITVYKYFSLLSPKPKP